MKVIATIPPYAPFLGELFAHPMISGVRLNTVMPIKESLEELLTRLKTLAGAKDVWIDLKCRQIRTTYGAFFNKPVEPQVYEFKGKKYVLDPSSPRAYGELRSPPWATLEISHTIHLDFSHGPIKCFMQDGQDSADIVEVIDGNRLIMLDGPRRLVGGGESINILHPSLEIDGYFTETDYDYIQAAKAIGLHTFMLSYVEKDSDITELLELDPEAQIVAKIESMKGVAWAKEYYSHYKDRVRLMPARGDLYVEVGRPDQIIQPLKDLILLDQEAIVASRFLSSLRSSPRPSCADITDIAFLLEIGYQHMMVGDDLCFNHDALFLALDIMHAIGQI